MAELCGAVDACDHGDRLDRLELLLHRARPGAAQDAEPAAAGAWRGVAGAWRWFLSHPEVPGGAGIPARAPDLVQVGELRDLALGLLPADHRLLCRGRSLPHRPACARYSEL